MIATPVDIFLARQRQNKLNPRRASDHFASVLYAAMKAQGLTQEELAAKSGVHQGAISRYLAGKHEPKLSVAAAIAGALGISISDFIL